MSRIGKKIISIPKGVSVQVNGGSSVEIKGPKGTLSRKLHEKIEAVVEGETLKVVTKSDDKELSKFYGLSRSLLQNMVTGVSEGFSKSLILKGVGYRANVSGKDLNLTLGYSHPVVYSIPEGLTVKVDKQTTVIVSGIDKELVGQAAADIRAYRKPEPYHGKGVRYADEVIVTKAGKAGAKK